VVPHERVLVDLKAKEQKRPDFLKLNPNGKVPTLVVDGTPMFEALAINIWLGERFGIDKQLWPAPGTHAAGEALSWSAWAYVTYGSTATRLFHASGRWHGEGFQNAAQREVATADIAELLRILDERLTGRAFMLGASFTLVDLVVASAVGYSCAGGVSVAEFPRVKAWLENCQARPAARAALKA
jgi:GST-like protein